MLLTFFYVFYVFFSKSKNVTFLRFFALLHTFSRTMIEINNVGCVVQTSEWRWRFFTLTSRSPTAVNTTTSKSTTVRMPQAHLARLCVDQLFLFRSPHSARRSLSALPPTRRSNAADSRPSTPNPLPVSSALLSFVTKRSSVCVHWGLRYEWWRSAVVSGVGLINEVNRHWARLVLGWVTASGRVNHLGM